MRTIVLCEEAQPSVSTIYCGEGAFEKELPCALESYSERFVFTDGNVSRLWGARIREVLGDVPMFVMPAGEQHKTEETLFALLQAMAKAQLHRTGCLIMIGGGVVGDVGGLAAALYMRGIACFQVPTTLLAQVDSSVGGKTAIDFLGIKNLVGAFNQPKAVFADPCFLSTLPPREVRCGIGEIVKHGALKEELFEKLLLRRSELAALNVPVGLIADNIAFKASVVAEDAKESGLRKSLNLGHTTAHALELALKTRSHGECVLLGTIFEAGIARRHENCDEGYLDELISLCKEVLGSIPALPPAKEWTPLALLDKKNTAKDAVVVTAPVRRGTYRLIALPFAEYAREAEEIQAKLC